MKRFLLFFAFLGTITVSVQAQQAVIAQGNCGAQGNNLTWVLTDDDTLTISGSGAMEDYNYNKNDDSCDYPLHCKYLNKKSKKLYK